MAERNYVGGFVTIGSLARYFNKKDHVDFDVVFKNCHTYSSAIWMGIFGSSGNDLKEPDIIGLDSMFEGMNVPGPNSFELAKKIHAVGKYSLLNLW